MSTRESDVVATRLVCPQVLTTMLSSKIQPLTFAQPLDQKGT